MATFLRGLEQDVRPLQLSSVPRLKRFHDHTFNGVRCVVHHAKLPVEL